MMEKTSELTLAARQYLSPRITRRRFRLRIERGEGPQIELVSSEPRVIVGSHPSATLVVNDSTVSRFHFEIVTDHDGHLIRDLGSKNGTEIAGLRVREAYLQQRAKIQIGRSQLSFLLLGESDELNLHPDKQFGAMLAVGPVMRALFDRLARVAARDTTLLLEGESGTGKELAARAVHENSPRRDRPFVVVDCGSIPRNLIEAELFGHEKGAFTGATQARPGAFVRAHTGTIFLDEIGELDLDLQPRLLGALERREVKPIGSSSVIPVDVRVISATNKDLRREVNRKTFREDLYYRVAVACVTMPPLRERPEDIPMLIEHFLDQQFARDGRRHTLDEDSIRRLVARPWPGNIRELRNVVEQIVAFGDEEIVPAVSPTGTPPPLPLSLVTATSAGASGAIGPGGSVAGRGGGLRMPLEPFKVGKARVVDQFELEYLTNLLAAHDGRITASAAAAEVDRVHFLRLLDKHNLRKPRV
jgi:DNA-binding NtrC family response regulator